MILRWILLLRARGIAITTGDAIKLFLVSSFVGSFLPAGIGGDAARAYGLSRDADDRQRRGRVGRGRSPARRAVAGRDGGRRRDRVDA